MQTPDYFWNYLPLLMQILVAVGFGAGVLMAIFGMWQLREIRRRRQRRM